MTVFPDAGEPGYSKVTIDGVDLSLVAQTMEITPEILQYRFQGADGGGQRSIPYQSVDGTPNQVRQNIWTLPYDLLEGDPLEEFERIAANGNDITLCFWRRLYLSFNGVEGQTMLHLTRNRRVAHRILGALLAEDYTDVRVATVDEDGIETELAVTYSATLVTTATVVAADTIVISDIADANGNVPMKMGTALLAPTVIRMQYYPVYTAYLSGYSGAINGREESKTLIFTEA